MRPSTVHVYVFDTLADWELGYALAHIGKRDWQREPGRYTVRTVGTTRAPIRTMGNLAIVPDLAIDELDAGDSALLVLAGGNTWGTPVHAPVLARAAELLAAGRRVAAICGGTEGLARAGLLDDRQHTSNAREYLAATGYRGGAHYVDAPAVDDGTLITASGTEPVRFAAKIFAALELYTPEVLQAWEGLYETGKPEYYFALESATKGS